MTAQELNDEFLEAFQAKHYDAAEERILAAIEADGGFTDALVNYATFLTRVRKNFDAADEYFGKAVESNRKDPQLWISYCTFLAGPKKDAQKARQTYEDGIAENPESSTLLNRFAQFLHVTVKDHAAAEEYFQQGAALPGADASTFNNYAMFLRDHTRDMDAAEDMFKEALAADPEHASALNNYAQFLVRQRKQPASALPLFERAIAAAPNHPDIACNFAKYLHEQHELDRCIKVLEGAKLSNPTHKRITKMLKEANASKIRHIKEGKRSKNPKPSGAEGSEKAPAMAPLRGPVPKSPNRRPYSRPSSSDEFDGQSRGRVPLAAQLTRSNQALDTLSDSGDTTHREDPRNHISPRDGKYTVGVNDPKMEKKLASLSQSDLLARAERLTSANPRKGRTKGPVLWFFDTKEGTSVQRNVNSVGPTSVGRKETNDVCVLSKYMSRLHMTIIEESGRYVIQDAGSAGGTFVNGVKIAKGERSQNLNRGDIILAGKTPMIYLDDSNDPIFADMDAQETAVMTRQNVKKKDTKQDVVVAVRHGCLIVWFAAKRADTSTVPDAFFDLRANVKKDGKIIEVIPRAGTQCVLEFADADVAEAFAAKLVRA